ncbi:MAG: DUF1501 domain-containing protein [Planctomycetes bacterium]|nr:DUF1501 domain-containing protein [Planctomycetota bacterium]
MTTRREFLQIGGLQVGAITALGVSLPEVLARYAVADSADKNINCIFMFLQGGASHIDMYDMKPEMSAEIRGEFEPVSTNLPGLQLCDRLPKLSQCTDKFSLIRSLQSYTSKHGEGDVHIMSGSPVDKNLQAPGFGAVMSLQKRRLSQVPPFVHFGKMKHPSYHAPGFAGYLGRRYDPYLVDQDPNAADFSIREFDTAADVDSVRLSDRKALFNALDRYQAKTEKQLDFARTHDEFYEQAFALSTSQRAKQAFDISQEPEKLRDAYGRNRVGQGLLMARRLVEAGVRFVAVKGYVDTKIYGWDHHWGIFPHLKSQLPVYDQSYAALLNDLDDRGMLANTLVITAGEFGRTPRINKNKRGPGRDHWGNCFSLTIGGGGVKTGRVIGASDNFGAEVKDRPVSVADFAATVYHALGLDPQAKTTVDGRTVRMLPAGRIVQELF